MPSSIPVLALTDAARDRSAFAQQLGAGFGEFGFVGIRDHGVPEPLIRAALDTTRAFFAQPLDEKSRCEIRGGAGQRGYTRLGIERAKDQALPDRKEFFHVGREVARDHPLAHALLPNVWPEGVAGFKAAQLDLFRELERVGGELLAGVACFLGLRDDWFAPKIERGNSILRAIHYPPFLVGEAAPPRQVRAAAHEDINLITLLVGSGEPGLEILTRRGEWIPVTTLPGTIVVNVGDMLQRLTNHRLPSTTHRVVNPPPPWDARSRFSIPFFQHFGPDVVIETLPGCISREQPNRYPTPITANDYLQQRLHEIGLAAD